MSNDNKTLADVKPGGRVRLATVPYDRARDLIADAYNAGTHGIGYSQQAMELHDAIIPAQPSPGGQGDALVEAAMVIANAAHDRALMSDILSGMRAHEAQSLRSAILALDAALAARQPVGEPDFFMVRDEDESRWRESDEATFDSVKRQRPDDAIALDTAPPAQAVDLGAVREAVRKAWQKCAAGESVDLQFGTLLALIDSMAVGNG